MQVKVDQGYSEEYVTQYSVVSTLGSLCFLLFINDRPNYITNAKVMLYADVAAIVVTGSTSVELEADMSDVQDVMRLYLGANQVPNLVGVGILMKSATA
ncbi:hypothetical protein WA026_023663 [Henosepilachna vigintioctopunctata]|uniref:Reverse transcriptase domain-containing protein n=1 Tax=Henosepilachna vigintioctopunctata TaxID=420089 RepID=A0AAW1V4B6_9CUCU